MNEGETTPGDTLSTLMETFNKNKSQWMGQAAILFLQFTSLTRQVEALTKAVSRLEKNTQLILHRQKKK